MALFYILKFHTSIISLHKCLNNILCISNRTWAFVTLHFGDRRRSAQSVSFAIFVQLFRPLLKLEENGSFRRTGALSWSEQAVIREDGGVCSNLIVSRFNRVHMRHKLLLVCPLKSEQFSSRTRSGVYLSGMFAPKRDLTSISSGL